MIMFFKRWFSFRSISVMLAMFLMIATLGIIYLINRYEENLQFQVLLSESENIKNTIRIDLSSRIFSLNNITKNAAFMQNLSQESWQKYLKPYFSAQPGYQSIMWLDASLQKKVSASASSEDWFNDFNLNSEKWSALLPHRENQKLLASIAGPVDLKEGLSGILLYIPIYENNTLKGIVAAVLNPKLYFENIIKPREGFPFIAKVMVNDKLVYQNMTSDNKNKENHLAWDFYYANWKITLKPAQRPNDAQGILGIEEIIFIVGTCFTLLLARIASKK